MAIESFLEGLCLTCALTVLQPLVTTAYQYDVINECLIFFKSEKCINYLFEEVGGLCSTPLHL